MTDDEVLQLYNSKDSSAFDCSIECERCGNNWGFHNGIQCQPNKVTTFKPVNSKYIHVPLIGNIPWDVVPTWKPGDKKSRIAPSKKVYTTECPCGLHPSQCEYHGK